MNGDELSTRECGECGALEAQPTTVQYVDGSADLLNLCASCSNTFRSGSFVEKLVVQNDE